MRNLAVMMDCGVRKYGYTIGEFYQKFLSSGVSRQFGKGIPAIWSACREQNWPI